MVATVNPESFDTRVDEPYPRLPTGVARSIAVAVAGLSDLQRGDLFLEVGAGSGELGIDLRRLVPRYLGFDKSAAMLDRFRQRFGTVVEPADTVDIVQADAEQIWPAPTGGVHATFGSRVFHLLTPDHLVREVFRVSSHRGMTLMIGRVRRNSESVRSRIREQMQRFL